MSDNDQRPKGKRRRLVETKVPRGLPFKPDGAGGALVKMKINPKNKTQQEPQAKKTPKKSPKK